MSQIFAYFLATQPAIWSDKFKFKFFLVYYLQKCKSKQGKVPHLINKLSDFVAILNHVYNCRAFLFLIYLYLHNILSAALYSNRCTCFFIRVLCDRPTQSGTYLCGWKLKLHINPNTVLRNMVVGLSCCGNAFFLTGTGTACYNWCEDRQS